MIKNVVFGDGKAVVEQLEEVAFNGEDVAATQPGVCRPVFVPERAIIHVFVCNDDSAEEGTFVHVRFERRDAQLDTV